MSLQVWLPLNKNVIENKGLSDVVFTNSNPSGITFVDSGIESCYNFNATSGNGIVGNFLNFAIKHSFSICGWFKTTSTSTYTPIVCMTTGIRLFVGGLNRLQLSNGTNIVSCNSNITTNDGKWHHTVGTYDISDNKLRIYIDGQLKNTVGYNQGELYDNPWHNATTVGKDLNGSEADYRWFDGSVSDIRIYDHALSDKEVYELAKGLMFHLKLDNTDLYDCSGFGNTIVATGGTLTNEANTARYSKSLNFNNAYIKIKDIIPSGAEQFSFSFWINPSVNQTSCIWNGRTTMGAAVSVFYLGGGIRFDDDSQTQSDNISLNTWTHVVCTYTKGGQKKIYLNGVLNKNVSSSTITKSNTRAAIGMSLTGDGTPSGNPLAGNLSDFRIYRKALSDTEVSELYKNAGSMDNTGKLHCYELCEKTFDDGKSLYVDLGLPSGILWGRYNEGVNPNQLTTAEDWYGTVPSQSIEITSDDLEELKNNTNHSWVANYKGITGLDGLLLTSKTNGNSIFIPGISESYIVEHGGGNGYFDYSYPRPTKLSCISCIEEGYDFSLLGVDKNGANVFYADSEQPITTRQIIRM